MTPNEALQRILARLPGSSISYESALDESAVDRIGASRYRAFLRDGFWISVSSMDFAILYRNEVEAMTFMGDDAQVLFSELKAEYDRFRRAEETRALEEKTRVLEGL